MKRHKQRRKKGKENKDKEQANQEQSRQTTDINSTESSDGIGRSTGERVKENRDKLILGKTQGTQHPQWQCTYILMDIGLFTKFIFSKNYCSQHD